MVVEARTERMLREKFKLAIDAMINEAENSAIETTTPSEPGGLVAVLTSREDARDQAIAREAKWKAHFIHQFLEQEVFGRIADLESKVATLEARLETLSSTSVVSAG